MKPRPKVLDKIRDTLETFLDNPEIPMQTVGYGGVRKTDLQAWNYFVFNRKRRSKNNKQDRQTFYKVHIVMEDYIPEGYVDAVIEALEASSEAGTKLRQTLDDVEYNYVYKGNTDLVVEIATITFYHPEKRCC